MNPFSEHVRLLLFLFGVALLAGIAWVVHQPLSDFRMRVSCGRVRVHGRFPSNLRGDVERLLRDEMGLKRATIYGRWTPALVLRIRVRGRMTPAERQRIRNYLGITLR